MIDQANELIAAACDLAGPYGLASNSVSSGRARYLNEQVTLAKHQYDRHPGGRRPPARDA